MKLSRGGDYGLRTVLALAERPPDTVVSVRELSQEQGVPAAFLAKIVGRLTEAGILRTERGATGGTALATDSASITMLAVVEAIDGPIVLNYCVACPSACRFGSDCVVMDAWAEAQAQLRRTLAEANFAELARRAAARGGRTGIPVTLDSPEADDSL
jgi:Rrf2 family protein